MKRLFLILVLALSFSLTANAQHAQSLVDSLNASNQIAEQISDEPNTGFERYVSVHNYIWLVQEQKVKVNFVIHVLSPSGQVIPAFSKHFITTVSNVNEVNPTNGADIPATDSTSARVGEYDFLYTLVDSGAANIIDLFRSQIVKIDQEGRFN